MQPKARAAVSLSAILSQAAICNEMENIFRLSQRSCITIPQRARRSRNRYHKKLQENPQRRLKSEVIGEKGGCGGLLVGRWGWVGLEGEQPQDGMGVGEWGVEL